ncbi:MAG TPA: Sec-independent protein translocase protein TatB [Rhizomicrobium sp.]|jgi:sec-independent protein translocase protein TatB|nr:Sec-independent protein translocase protein TatB [Rhizomicrobium sp.]
MLDFSWSHILIVLIVALVVVGPKDLPRLMRIVGQWMGKARAMADEFRKSFDDMARQSELDELRKEIESLRNERPLADVERELNRSIIPEEMRSKAPPPPTVSIDAEPVETETAPPPRSGEFESPSIPEPAVVDADGYTPPSP